MVTTVIFVVALAGAAALMPDNWMACMGTIETYQEDASAEQVAHLGDNLEHGTSQTDRRRRIRSGQPNSV